MLQNSGANKALTGGPVDLRCSAADEGQRIPRTIMIRLLSFLFGLICLAMIAPAGGATAAAGPEHTPVVVELFTSQSCSSCPPADAMLRNLAGRSDIVALSWHVDYWNTFVHGKAGRWQDPFSSSQCTRRQRIYNRRIRGTSSVYTPQAIIGGEVQVPAANHDAVSKALASAVRTAGSRLSIETHGGDVWSIRLSGQSAASADVLLVRFLKQRRTEVLRGENRGRTIVNVHIVRDVAAIGRWSGGTRELTVSPGLEPDEGCAVLVQMVGQGPILNAAYCPH